MLYGQEQGGILLYGPLRHERARVCMGGCRHKGLRVLRGSSGKEIVVRSVVVCPMHGKHWSGWVGYVRVWSWYEVWLGVLGRDHDARGVASGYVVLLRDKGLCMRIGPCIGSGRR